MPFDVNMNALNSERNITNVSDMQWNSRKGTLEPSKFKDRVSLDVKMKPLRQQQELQSHLVRGDNAIKPLSATLPVANNGCAVFYGLPGSGKTTGILTMISIIMAHVPHITFNDGETLDTGDGSLDDYFGNEELIGFNEKGNELPLLACYVTSPTANQDVKFQNLGVPIICIEDLDVLASTIAGNMEQFNSWWRTGRLLYEMREVFNEKDTLADFFKAFKKCLMDRNDMRAPSIVKSNYNTGPLAKFFKSFLTNTDVLVEYRDFYNELSAGQRKRFMFLPMQQLQHVDHSEPMGGANNTFEQALRQAHLMNQEEGVRIHTPFYEEYFVSIRPRSFVVVDDHAGEDYIHRSNTAFTRLLQRRRHLHVSVFIALQRMHALSRFARSMVTDIAVYPGFGDNFLKDMWEEHFTEAIPSYDVFKSLVSRCTLNGYKPLVYFKEAGEFRCGFTEQIEGIGVMDQTYAIGGRQVIHDGV